MFANIKPLARCENVAPSSLTRQIYVSLFLTPLCKTSARFCFFLTPIAWAVRRNVACWCDVTCWTKVLYSTVYSYWFRTTADNVVLINKLVWKLLFDDYNYIHNAVVFFKMRTEQSIFNIFARMYFYCVGAEIRELF